MTNLVDLKDIAPLPIWDDIVARTVSGDHIDLAIVELAPGSIVPEHRHDNEQLGLLIEGSATFRIGGETRELGPGAIWRITGGTPHEVRAGDRGAVVVDVFTPRRGDWAELEPGRLEAPRWPR